MSKAETIKKIKAIITNYGTFGSGEVEVGGETHSPCISAQGNLCDLAEYFNHDDVGINVYKPSGFSSDPIDDYKLKYEELSGAVLNEILKIAKEYAKIQEATI